MQTREFKIVLLGDGGVGKSSITVRRVQDRFVEEYDPTIWDDYRIVVELYGERVVLDILDTAGQEEFSAMRDQWMRVGEGFILVYSITNRRTLESIEFLREQIYRVKDFDYDHYIPMIIAGNKIDKEEEREISTEEVQELADRWGIGFIECSAKENINIIDLFDDITECVWNGPIDKIDPLPERTRGCLLC
ncbi:Ras-like protein [Entamoeba marina]